MKNKKKTNDTFAVVPFSLHTSYQILCPKQLQGVSDPKKAADIILQTTGLADDAFRLGATKARFPFSLVCMTKFALLLNTTTNNSFLIDIVIRF